MPNTAEILSQLLKQRRTKAEEKVALEDAVKAEKERLDEEIREEQEQQGLLQENRRISALTILGVMGELHSLSGVLEENGARGVFIGVPENPYDHTRKFEETDSDQTVEKWEEVWPAPKYPIASLEWTYGEISKGPHTFSLGTFSDTQRYYSINIGVLFKGENWTEKWKVFGSLDKVVLLNGQKSGIIDKKGNVKDNCIFVVGGQTNFVRVRDQEQTRGVLSQAMAQACMDPRVEDRTIYPPILPTGHSEPEMPE